MNGSKYTPPIDCEVDIDTSTLRGKTAIVTGGANGLGEAYTRALVEAGATVVIGDLDKSRGEKLARELPSAKFVKCDTTSWQEQVRLFREAAALSPTGKISYVVANAGVIGRDDIFNNSGKDEDLKAPDLKIMDVNINGTLLTSKLAMHYFIKQNGTTPSSSQEDTCLILISSGAGFLDCLRIPQYAASKWAMRGIMHSLRRTAHFYKSRVNVISPWYVKTSILSQEDWDTAKRAGVEFAEAADGGRCLLRILADSTVNGHNFFLSARKWAPKSGFFDLGVDDYESDLLQEIQADQVSAVPVDVGLFA